MAKFFQDHNGNTSSKRINGTILLGIGLIMFVVTWIMALVHPHAGFNAAIKIGAIFASKFTNLPYLKVVFGTICLITIMVYLFTGIMGLLVLLVASCIGALPIVWGVRRSHCMGVLLIPIILHFLL